MSEPIHYTWAQAVKCHDLLREPGRVSVDKAKFLATIEELHRQSELAHERFNISVKLVLERDEARKELVRVRALHRIELSEAVAEADKNATDQAVDMFGGKESF